MLAKKYNEEAQLCHRLDKETSGVLILSKNQHAYKFMNQQFERRTLEKEYHAISDGLHDFKELQIDKPLSTLPKGATRIDLQYGKRSVTVFNSMKAYKRHTLINCRPKTGRMHQIRVHLAYLNAPIAGDITYGGKPFYLSTIKRNYKIGKFEEEQPLIHRMALHAYRVRFKLLSGDYKEVKASYPKDFRVLLNQLEKNL
jgi:23S rRNA pseudouridine955/2504/2580 synthase